MEADSILTMIFSSLRPEIDRALDVIRQEAYTRGRAEAKAEILALLQIDNPPALEQQRNEPALSEGQAQDVGPRVVHNANEDPELVAERKRAPKGLPRELTLRVVRSRPDGVTAKDIADAAASDNERMIKESTIRGELRRGREEGLFEERNRRWFLKRELEF